MFKTKIFQQNPFTMLTETKQLQNKTFFHAHSATVTHLFIINIPSNRNHSNDDCIHYHIRTNKQ